jgi:hypothetical protein
MAEAWSIRGEYMESCNCEVLCACLLGPRSEQGWALARPTEGYCNALMLFKIHDGRYGQVPLAGTMVGLAIHTPQAMGLGDWTFALYLDERVSGEQRDASEKIFSGQSGGAVGRLFGPLIKKRLPNRVTKMELGRDGRQGWGQIPGVMDIKYEGILGFDGSASWLDNLRHFVSKRLYTCKSTSSVFRDHGMDWNNSGRNAYYASFEWAGP